MIQGINTVKFILIFYFCEGVLIALIILIKKKLKKIKEERAIKYEQRNTNYFC